MTRTRFRYQVLTTDYDHTGTTMASTKEAAVYQVLCKFDGVEKIWIDGECLYDELVTEC